VNAKSPEQPNTYTVEVDHPVGSGWTSVSTLGPPVGAAEETSPMANPPIQPKVPHDALQVEHSANAEDYTVKLLNPNGSEAAPPLVFHRGSPVEGWHGWTTEKVLEALIEHLEYHQSTDFACEENNAMLLSVRAAHQASRIRVARRKERGVLYDHKKP